MTLFDLAFLNDKVERLEKEQNREDFWSDQRKAVSIIDDYNDAKEERDTYLKIQKNHEDIKSLLFACTEDDEDTKDFIDEMIIDLGKTVKVFRQKLLFKGKFDRLNVVLEIRSGAGGTEAQDWADML